MTPRKIDIMAKFRDFGAPTAEGKETISFKLHDEEFFCNPSVQGRVLLSIVADTSSDDPATVALVTDKFFSYALNAESLKRFNELTTSPEKIVTVETLGEIVGWLVEQYSDRPEEQPEV